MVLHGKALFAASTAMAATGFLLFGYDQAWKKGLHRVKDNGLISQYVGCHVRRRSKRTL